LITHTPDLSISIYISLDVFEAFLEAGDIFHRPTAQRLLTHIYASGNSVPPGEAFRAFRGREPAVQAMLRKKGLDGEAYAHSCSRVGTCI
jgi:Zn-dependent oligopeptidase